MCPYITKLSSPTSLLVALEQVGIPLYPAIHQELAIHSVCDSQPIFGYKEHNAGPR